MKKKTKKNPSIILLLHSYTFLPNREPTVVNRVFFFFMTHIGGRLHRVFLQNLQHSSLYLSELARAFVGFHLLSPRTSLLTLYNPAVTSTPSCRAEYSSSHPIFFFRVTISFPCFCARRSNPSSGAYPNITMSRAAICVLTGSAGGALLDRGQNNSFTRSSSHAHVISLLYFGNGTDSFITAGPGANIVFSL